MIKQSQIGIMPVKSIQLGGVPVKSGPVSRDTAVS